LGGAAMTIVNGMVAERADAASAGARQDPAAPVEISLHVNGRDHRLSLDARTTLLDALRNNLGLTGSKKGCDHGQCGACTVHIGGERRLSCLTLAMMVREAVTTIEGLAALDGSLHPMQQAFIDQDAFQCGYCTPRQIMSAIACVKEGHANSPADIRENMSGNPRSSKDVATRSGTREHPSSISSLASCFDPKRLPRRKGCQVA
jgi:xanthine dehydrogenase YagT iron-sulfur-binding subunit